MGMNQMQAMIQQAQKMQRELKKAQEALDAKEFVINKSGIVTVTVMGSKEIKSINIDKDAFDPENKELIEDSITLALKEAFEKIDAEVAEFNERITGRAGGLF